MELPPMHHGVNHPHMVASVASIVNDHGVGPQGPLGEVYTVRLPFGLGDELLAGTSRFGIESSN